MAGNLSHKNVVVSGAGSGGTSSTDDSAFTVGTDGVTPAGAVFQSTPDSVDNNDVGVVRMTQKRALLVALETPNADSAMDDTNDAVRVNVVAGAAAGGTSSDFGAAIPSAGTAAGFSDGTNMQMPRVFDGDSGAGTQYVTGVGLRKIASGGTVEAGTLADPLRTDPVGTTAQPVTDNGGSLTIDGSVTATLGAGDAVAGRVKLTDGTDVADILDLTNANPLTVAIVDGSGDQITSFGGGTQYTEGDTDTTITGTAMLMEGAANTLLAVPGTAADGLLVNLGANNDVAVTGSVTANAGTDLNTSLLALEAGGNLAGTATSLAVIDDWDETDRAKVNIIAGQAGITAGAGAVAANTPRVTIASDSPDVALLTTIDADTSSLAGTVSGTEIQVDVVAALPAGTNNIGDVDVLSIVSGTGATNLGKAEDAAHTTGDVGVMALAVRAAAPTERSAGPTDGDYEPLAVNEVGAVWITQTPSANGGLSIFRSLDLDETEEDVKTVAGTLYWYYIYNNAATTHFVKFYNATAATVIVGTTTPVLTLPIPAGAAANVSIDGGLKFDTAICVAATTGVADADTGAPAANAIVVNIGYK